MNRRDRRRAAREIVRNAGVRSGTDKAQARREVAAQLRLLPDAPVSAPEEVTVGGTQDVAVSQRKSGLYAVRKRFRP